MSDIKIQPSATGSATVTLTAPATSTARTVTLPDTTGTLLASEGAVVVNESGADVDFRVESDNDANALFVQGSDGNVGINNSAPTQRLEINGNSQLNAHDNPSGSGGYFTTKGMQIGNAFDAGLSGGDDDRNAIVWNERGTSLLLGTNNIERMRIDYNGNVGIGVTPETDIPSLYKALQINGAGSIYAKESGTDCRLHLSSNASMNSSYDDKYIKSSVNSSTYIQSAGTHTFQVAPSGSADAAISWTTAMTIDNIACTMVGNNQENNSAAGYSSSTPHLSCSGNGYASLTVRRTADTGACVNFFGSSSASSTVGNITVSGSSTSYNTSSDYRLKENVDYDWDATTRLKQLKPARFNFIADETNTLVDGFIAHEVSSVVPEAISGTKDKVDDNGNAVHQGIDQSKLVPLLVKTIQELEARITAGGL